jgi:hypothetical protein
VKTSAVVEIDEYLFTSHLLEAVYIPKVIAEIKSKTDAPACEICGIENP